MAEWWILVFGILGLSCNAYGQNLTSKYDCYSLLRIFANNESQLETMYKFNDPENEIEILKHSHGLNDSLDLLVPPNRLSFITDFTKDMIVETKTRNYGRMVDLGERTARRRSLNSGGVYEYKSVAQINEFIEQVARAHPKEVKIVRVGNSFEGREMKLVKISTKPNAKNPIIFVDAGIHAREWVAPAMALYLIHRMTHDPEAKIDMEGVDWYILPIVNPDGYEYSRQDPNNRMWRKTRSQSPVRNCLGVDANRNYGFKWAVSGVSMNPCDKETYAGPKPFSEPETKIVRNIMMENRDRIKLYVSLHSYGQYLVYPWGYTGDFLPKSWKKLDKLARLVSNSVERAGGLPFNVLSAGKWYPAAGGSDDYAFGAAGIPYSYTMELTDGYEFIYPEDQLRNVLPQLYQGFRTFGQQIKREFGINRRP